MLMIEPPPRACICGTTACAAKKTCLKLTPIIQSNSAGVTSASTWRWSLAALLTSTAVSPSDRWTSAMAARKASMSRRSQGTNSGAVPHADAISATSAPPAAWSISRNATRARWAAKARTKAEPMPLAPPVISTTRSARPA
jgi:hypothetical protein